MYIVIVYIYIYIYDCIRTYLYLYDSMCVCDYICFVTRATTITKKMMWCQLPDHQGDQLAFTTRLWKFQDPKLRATGAVPVPYKTLQIGVTT